MKGPPRQPMCVQTHSMPEAWLRQSYPNRNDGEYLGQSEPLGKFSMALWAELAICSSAGSRRKPRGKAESGEARRKHKLNGEAMKSRKKRKGWVHWLEQQKTGSLGLVLSPSPICNSHQVTLISLQNVHWIHPFLSVPTLTTQVKATMMSLLDYSKMLPHLFPMLCALHTAFNLIIFLCVS